uniref:Uncharacterized protein n=1 Tax=Arundo donax TaxID=35708 RepID=A0A0A8ZA38_ARUDO
MISIPIPRRCTSVSSLMFILFHSSSQPTSVGINSTRCTSSTPIARATVSFRVVNKIIVVATLHKVSLSRLVHTSCCQTSSNTRKKLFFVNGCCKLSTEFSHSFILLIMYPNVSENFFQKSNFRVLLRNTNPCLFAKGSFYFIIIIYFLSHSYFSNPSFSNNTKLIGSLFLW